MLSFSLPQLLYDAVDEYSNPIIPLYARLRQEVNKEILAKLPQFVNRTIEELLFGYSDETTRQIPRIREIFERYGVELKLTEYIRDGRFSVVTSVSLSSFLGDQLTFMCLYDH